VSISPIPEELSAARERIAGLAAKQTVSFVRSTWKSWLREACWTDDKIEGLLGRLSSDEVTRSDVAALAQSVEQGSADLAELLALTLIWGRGKRNGRMKNHMIGLLSRRALIGELRVVWEEARSGDLVRAHESWSLPGLREPFFTKFLWACTADLSETQRCLVLDGNVRRSLVALGVRFPRRSRALRYKIYVESLRSWKGAGAGPEDLEWALFVANGSVSRLGSLGAAAGR